MTAARPALGNAGWSRWLEKFPALPVHGRFELEWTRSRLEDRLRDMPPAAALPTLDKAAVGNWLSDYADQFVLECEGEIEVWDPLAIMGVASLLVGVLAAPLVAAASYGAFVMSAALLGRGILRRREDRTCDRLEREIRRLLMRIRQGVR